MANNEVGWWLKRAKLVATRKHDTAVHHAHIAIIMISIMNLYYPQNCSQWCRNSDVSHLISQRWDGPYQPTTPMEKLVSMGFADRALNTSISLGKNTAITLRPCWRNCWIYIMKPLVAMQCLHVYKHWYESQKQFMCVCVCVCVCMYAHNIHTCNLIIVAL